MFYLSAIFNQEIAVGKSDIILSSVSLNSVNKFADSVENFANSVGIFRWIQEILWFWSLNSVGKFANSVGNFANYIGKFR